MLWLRTTDAAGTPTEPQDTPQVIVTDNALVEVVATQMPITERYTTTGLFYYPLYLGTGFSTGYYTIEYRWVLASTYIGSAADEFEIVAGGHADGAVTSLYFYERPHAKMLVHGVETGSILPGKNPSLD